MSTREPRPLETAAELYREMKKRGLHLSPKTGRDNALLYELSARLGCAEEKLEPYLRRTRVSAATFLRIFLEVAQPFVTMFREIWTYFAANAAPSAEQSIRIRFGFDDKAPEFDLEDFREWAVITEEFMRQVAVWPREAMGKLFELRSLLLESAWEPPLRKWEHYSPGRPYSMLELRAPLDDYGVMLTDIHTMFQRTMNAYLRVNEEGTGRALPELDEGDAPEIGALRDRAFLLTDLLPSWQGIFDRAIDIDTRRRANALTFYKSEIEPLLERLTVQVEEETYSALDVLNLPFWRERWRTYEVWIAVTTLAALSQFCPEPRVSNRRIAFDTEKTSVLADLRVRGYPSACVTAQFETPFECGSRKRIKPDLSICRDGELVAASRVVVVEAKQRLNLEADHVLKVGTSYLAGSPNATAVVIVNYDATSTPFKLPQRVHVVHSFRPGERDALKQFHALLGASLDEAGFRPQYGHGVLLLDVSGSMGRRYDSDNVRDSLRRVLKLPGIKVLRFSDGLLPGGDLTEEDSRRLTTGGGTDLAAALAQLDSVVKRPYRVLLVSDGGYGDARDQISQIEDFCECAPEELGETLTWLIRPSARASHSS